MILQRVVLSFFLLCPALSIGAEDSSENVDPWEPVNRRIFSFNEKLDQYALTPAAKGYRFVMPDPAERGVSNFVLNIYEFNSMYNSLLQGRPGNALKSAGRFLVNTVMGLGGLLDVATPMGIEHSPADFGQTLSVWGFDSGPYVMLPFFGPHTVRSGVGYFVDTYTSVPTYWSDPEMAYIFWTVEVLSNRADLLNADDLISGDRYVFVRNAYLQRRAYFLSGGEVDDSFSELEEDEFIDF